MISKIARSKRFIPLLLAAAVLAVIAWRSRPTPGELRVWFLATEGDAILIQAPNGDYFMVDGGEDPTSLLLHLGRELPFWKRSLAGVVLTSPEETWLRAQIPVFSRYEVPMVLIPDTLSDPALDPAALTHPAFTETDYALLKTWMGGVQQQRPLLHRLSAGQSFSLGGMQWLVLATGEKRQPGLVLQLEYGRTRIVLAGGMNDHDEANLQARALPTTVLAYPWERELPYELMRAWRPAMTVFTTAYSTDNPALLTYHERAQLAGHPFHTDLDGTIVVVSDGQFARVLLPDDPNHQ
jgi:hypothetical protein